MRVAVFGSFYRGFYVLNELLDDTFAGRVQVVGVATDNVAAPWVNAGKRVWQYPHDPAEETMVRDLARSRGIDVFEGRVNSPEFHARFEQVWRPELCLTATFGQRIGERLFSYPAHGFYNLHPSDEGPWPSRYAGGNPFRGLIDDAARHCVITLHKVDAGFDTGEVIARSPRIYIPPRATVVDMHKISSPIAGKLARAQLEKMLAMALAA